MDRTRLRNHVRRLAMVPETSSPFVSCFVDLREPREDLLRELTVRVREVAPALEPSAAGDLQDAWRSVEDFLAGDVYPGAHGAALFARAGEDPFFLPLQFRVPLSTWLAVGAVPNIAPLMELKDTFHRIIVVLSTPVSGRVFEVVLGEETRLLWRSQPELRQRVGREWTREHYQNHRRDRGERALREKIEVIDRLVAAGGETHIVLVGPEHQTARVRRAMPDALGERVIGRATLAGTFDPQGVAADVVLDLADREAAARPDLAAVLRREVERGGLAELGLVATRRALERGQVDVLVLDPDVAPARQREHLVRLAVRTDARVDLLRDSALLRSAEGIGCLLRFRLPREAPWEMSSTADRAMAV